MKLRYKIIGAIVLVVIVGSYFRRGKVPTDAVTLKPNEAGKVTVTPSQIINTQRDKITGETHVTITPNYGHGTTTVVDKNGTVTVKGKEVGVSNDFGLSLQYDSIGVADEFFYWRRLSLIGGSNFINFRTQKPQLNLWVGVGYRLPFTKLNNLSLYSGIDTARHAIVGLFLRLGNS